MKTLKDFTPEIKAKIPEYIKKGTEGVFDGGRYNRFDIKKAEKAVFWNYKKCGYKNPKVIVAENPLEQQMIYNKLMGTKQIYNSYLFTLNVYSDCYYYWYEFIRKEFNLPLSINDEFQECFKLQRESGIYSGIFGTEYCVVSKYPKKVYRDANKNLHRVDGQAVEWGYTDKKSKFDCYYIHGRLVDPDFFNKCYKGKITKNDFLKETNAENRGFIYEILGHEKILKLLDAQLEDSCQVVHENGDIETLELYKTKFVIPDLDEKLAWVKFVCPSTKTNYLISVNPSITKALAAASSTSDLFGVKDYSFTDRT